jgi:hypothetical protein
VSACSSKHAALCVRLLGRPRIVMSFVRAFPCVSNAFIDAHEFMHAAKKKKQQSTKHTQAPPTRPLPCSHTDSITLSSLQGRSLRAKWRD